MPAWLSGKVMAEGISRLKSLTMDELTGVINIYPWFGAARMELCERMSKVGGSEWGKEQYADAAMYIPSRTLVFDIMRSASGADYSDKDVRNLVKKTTEYRRTVKVVGGDFFSAEQYEKVKQEDDSFFSRIKIGKSDEPQGRGWDDPELGFCTETLAGIYAEQGYFAQAKKIYSRLMLRYPEKSAYFASLIQKLKEELTILIVFAAILLTIVVLLQNGKGEGMASNFTSANQTLGVRQTADILEKVSWGLVTFILVVSIITAFTVRTHTSGVDVTDKIEAVEEQPEFPSAPIQQAAPSQDAPVNEAPAE